MLVALRRSLLKLLAACGHDGGAALTCVRFVRDELAERMNKADDACFRAGVEEQLQAHILDTVQKMSELSSKNLLSPEAKMELANAALAGRNGGRLGRGATKARSAVQARAAQ
eukprot:gene16724-5213_t